MRSAGPLSRQIEPLRRLQVWQFSLYYRCTFGGYVALSLWLPHYLVAVYGLDIRVAGAVAIAFSLPAGLLHRVAEARGLTAVASETARGAIDGADLVVTSVTLLPKVEPFLNARWLKAGSFATMTDLITPWLPEGIAAFERIVIDDLEQEAWGRERLGDWVAVAAKDWFWWIGG
jgi:hypothetical protein